MYLWVLTDLGWYHGYFGWYWYWIGQLGFNPENKGKKMEKKSRERPALSPNSLLTAAPWLLGWLLTERVGLHHIKTTSTWKEQYKLNIHFRYQKDKRWEKVFLVWYLDATFYHELVWYKSILYQSCGKPGPWFTIGILNLGCYFIEEYRQYAKWKKGEMWTLDGHSHYAGNFVPAELLNKRFVCFQTHRVHLTWPSLILLNWQWHDETK